MIQRAALFAGSFDPYTNGHQDIVRKAAALFDEIWVVIGVNTAKARRTDAEAMAEAIRESLTEAGIANARVCVHEGLMADFCAERSIRWYVRGLRGGADYEYEEANARVNALLNPALETIYLRGDEPAVSSTMIRELLAFGRPVDAFLPAPVARLLAAQAHRA